MTKKTKYDLTIGDIMPPRGTLMTLEESKEYTREKLKEFQEEGILTEEEAEYLCSVWAK